MGKKVLVVDDDPVIRLLIEEYLSSHGHQVEVLENGSSCIDNLKNGLPDLVVLDMQMPDMTGIEVLKSIRDNPETQTLPVILLSANCDSESVANRENVTASGFLQKPFDMKEILSAIEDVKE